MSRYPRIDLSEALVLVTGGARGIGLATVRAFHAQGARVAIGDLDADLAASEAAAIGPAVAGITVLALSFTRSRTRNPPNVPQ